MKQADLEDIKAKAIPVLTQAGIKRAALFGSYARGDNTQNSDVDILVELPENATLFELGGLKVDLEETLKKNVDILTYKSLSPHIKDSILNNQYPLL